MAVDDHLPDGYLLSTQSEAPVACGSGTIWDVANVLTEAAPAYGSGFVRLITLVNTVVVRCDDQPVPGPSSIAGITIT